MIQPDTSEADIPAQELIVAVSPSTRRSNPTSRATRIGQTSDSVNAHPPSSTRHTAGISHLAQRIDGRSTPTRRASHTDCTTGSAPPATAAMATGSTGASPTTVASATPPSKRPSPQPPASAQTMRARSGHVTLGWNANCSARMSTTEVSAAILLTASIGAHAGSLVDPSTATVCSPATGHQHVPPRRPAVYLRRPESNICISRHPERLRRLRPVVKEVLPPPSGPSCQEARRRVPLAARGCSRSQGKNQHASFNSCSGARLRALVIPGRDPLPDQ